MTINWSSQKSNSSPLLNDSMVIWSNLAFIPDDQCEECDDSSEGNYSISSSRSAAKCTSDFKGSYSFSMENIPQEEETKLREELEKEIEKQLEQEIMEGILDLVRKLSNLKTKRIIRSLKKFNLEEFLNVLYGSSFCDTGGSCKVDICSSADWNNSQPSPAKSVSKFSDEYFVQEEVLEDTDIESTIERWTYYSD